MLFFLINYVENAEKFQDGKSMTAIALLMSALHAPHFLNGVISSITLLSGILTFHSLSARSELVIMRSCGLSIWAIIKPVILAAFGLGIFWIAVFDPISIISDKYFFLLDKKFVKSEMRDAIEPSSGIWLRQENQENFVGEFRQFFKDSSLKQKKTSFNPDFSVESLGERSKTSSHNNSGSLFPSNVFIYAKKIYPNSLQFGDVSFWFFDKNQAFYKKIDAKFSELKDGWWQLESAIINDSSNINSVQKTIKISTNLSQEFVRQKIVNDFKMPELYSVFAVPNLISEMENAGLSNVKFKIRFNSLLSLPVILIAMSVLGAFFGINHIRSGRANMMIFFGVVFGLFAYISLSIINALGSSGILSVFASTWVIATLILAVALLMISSKEFI